MLLLFDLVYLLLAVVFYGGALIPGVLLVERCHALFGWPWTAFALPVAYFAFLVALVLEVGLVRLLLVPTPKPGRHPMPFSGGLVIWSLHLLLQRFINAGLIEDTLMYLNGLRTLYFRLMGAKVSLSATISGNTRLMDLTGLSVGRKAIIGAGVSVFGHYVVEKNLVIAPNRIADRVVVGAFTKIAPGLDVKEGAFIGAACLIGTNVTIGARARIEGGSALLPGTVVPPGEIWAGVPARRVEKGWEELQ